MEFGFNLLAKRGWCSAFLTLLGGLLAAAAAAVSERYTQQQYVDLLLITAALPGTWDWLVPGTVVGTRYLAYGMTS